MLTEAGFDFMPVVFAMFRWGKRHLASGDRFQLTLLGCGAAAQIKIRCGKEHLVPPDELGIRLVTSP
ncbi:transcriptional regulatory domain protein [Mycobacterium kansasii 732]|uniref:Uncharacterized protein n=1 Tax=Mycobacterium pseudokansasii TaxID=2341080 RepID=A0A498QQ20_9MYCO|nr:transcriptional regulatory domain protein [Mycobacterium kansasii 732]VAZ91090.1 hypothetical protein LAUMK35_01489 [Mycobacterium pseudokansasii]VAZ91981.1 hypothetical protein LAUMK21_01488 [Mycobacterium pseudokansasii]VBA48453.1 hypothetical protein LAUMK142_01350 [Mycobacterium pseudokansasii]